MKAWARIAGPIRTAFGAAAFAVSMAGCALLKPTPAPLRTVGFGPGEGDADVYALLLPGRGGHPRDYARAGLTDALRGAGFRGEIIGADAHIAYYFKRTVIERVREDIVLQRPGKRPWIVGVSMGGLGALLYEKSHPGEAAGIVLLAPYLGEDRVVAEIRAAGGLAAWEPGAIAPDDFQRELWWWIKQGGLDRVPVFLAWGRGDSFHAANALLAEQLPPERVAVVEGGHFWTTWTPAFDALLARGACDVPVSRR